MSEFRETILFVGAGGAVAGKLLPELAKHYDIVGVGGKRRELGTYCREFISCELTRDGPRIFVETCSRHSFAGIVWNAVRYHPLPLLDTSRATMHLEIDLAVALPLECIKEAQAHDFSGVFVLVTSGLAFGVKRSWGSYSIGKRGQVILAEYLSQEGSVRAKAIALGTIEAVPLEVLTEVFMRALQDADPDKVLYTAYGPQWT